MENTGRLTRSVAPSAQRILFGEAAAGGWDRLREMLHLSSRVDLAHVVMLAEQGIVPREKARRLLAGIQGLQRQDFAPLRGRPMARGPYLLYEDVLIERLGSAVAGILPTARSRNDLNATVLRLQIRRPYARLTRELLRLGAVLLERAARYARVVMPLYTHGQPAMPSTYGHYLAGIAYAMNRDLRGIVNAAEELDSSPLGAVAGAGTPWPVDIKRTARLLGFARTVDHSIDAVGSRDLVLRLLGAAAVGGVCLSRLAADLLQWSTVEFGFLELPDSVVGSSSVMPQKRNPFLLEHVLGKTALVQAAFQGAATAMHGTPFTNSVAVGTESVKPLWPALAELTDAITLVRLVVAAARPRPERMARSGALGHVTASIVADELVRRRELDFRSAHGLVGRALSAGETLLEIDQCRAVGMLRYGNGPAPDGAEPAARALRRSWQECARRRRSQLDTWATAERLLEEAVSGL
jgi:argininosuccinate lyase